MKPDFEKTISILAAKYPGIAASEKSSAWECLLFTALSARTRDKQTEIVFQKLMKKYPTINDLATAKTPDVERVLGTIGLFRAKARSAIGMAKKLRDEFHGQVPKTIDELITLPGVGRKTASCVLVYAYHQPAIPVDTHVHRIVNRLGWVNTKTAEQTELALRKVLPEKLWLTINRVMVFFGRDICVPTIPHCDTCPVFELCAYHKKYDICRTRSDHFSRNK
jgi:endonuclease-3